MNKRGLIYARVSTDDQAENGISLDTQVTDCTEFCQKNNIDIIDTIIDDGVSAYKVMFFSRPHHAKIEELILSQGIDHIIVTHGDRLFRQVADGLSVREILAKNNISILYVREEQIDTTTPEGSIFVLFKEGIAQYTSD